VTPNCRRQLHVPWHNPSYCGAPRTPHFSTPPPPLLPLLCSDGVPRLPGASARHRQVEALRQLRWAGVDSRDRVRVGGCGARWAAEQAHARTPRAPFSTTQLTVRPGMRTGDSIISDKTTYTPPRMQTLLGMRIGGGMFAAPPAGGAAEPADDLHLVFRIVVERHPLYARVQDDLVVVKRVTLEEALCGVVMLLPHPCKRQIRVEVPVGHSIQPHSCWIVPDRELVALSANWRGRRGRNSCAQLRCRVTLTPPCRRLTLAPL